MQNQDIFTTHPFLVSFECKRPLPEKRFSTFLEAERYARWHVARHRSIVATIWGPPGPGKKPAWARRDTYLAAVRTDYNHKVWTDLSDAGALFV